MDDIADRDRRGAPVVALHSLFFDGTMFDAVRPLLGERSVLTPDLPGHGIASAVSIPSSLDELAEAVVHAVETRYDEPVHLVGSAVGAYIAIIALAERPDLFVSGVLSGATGDAESRPQFFADFTASIRAAEATEAGRLIREVMFGSTFLSTPSVELDRWSKRFGEYGGTAADLADVVFGREPLWDRISAIKAPMLLLAGDEDRAKPAPLLARVAERLADAQLVEVPGAGHSVFVERPDFVGPRLASWLPSVEPVNARTR